MSGPRPSDLLAGLPVQFDMRSEAEKEKAAHLQTRAAMRESSQLASLALENNENLWNTNKRLKQELREAEGAARCQEARANQLQRQLDAIPNGVELATLKVEVEQLRRANKALGDALAASQLPELDSEARQAATARLVEQREQLATEGALLSEEELQKIRES